VEVGPPEVEVGPPEVEVGPPEVEVGPPEVTLPVEVKVVGVEGGLSSWLMEGAPPLADTSSALTLRKPATSRCSPTRPHRVEVQVWRREQARLRPQRPGIDQQREEQQVPPQLPRMGA
jgi:hypothetical protein